MAGDARGYSWPPFTEGNTANLRHGAYSPRRWKPIAERYVERVRQTSPWLASEQFAGTLKDWAEASAQIDLLDDFLDRDDVSDDDQAVALRRRDYLVRRRLSLARELGLTPMAMLKILDTIDRIDRRPGLPPPTLADAIDEIRQRGRAALAARGALPALEEGES